MDHCERREDTDTAAAAAAAAAAAEMCSKTRQNTAQLGSEAARWAALSCSMLGYPSSPARRSAADRLAAVGLLKYYGSFQSPFSAAAVVAGI